MKLDPRLRLLLGALPTGLVVGLARCGPVGRWGKAPGTTGSLLGVGLFLLVFQNLPLLGQCLLGALLAGLAVLICDEAERRLHKRDPGEIILDEVVAQPLVFFGLPAALGGTVWAWGVLLLGFGLFRLFDIWKPLVIHRLQFLPGGIGVVADDLAAALAAWLVLHGVLFAALQLGWIG
jgi:phosphatidylglycerophosphatase A